MKILFATTNPAKVSKYKKRLEEHGIELLTVRDLDFSLDIDENGKNALENARLKAKAYYEKTRTPTIGMDNNLFIEELAEAEQPGTHVKRINGRELSDEEMIAYYVDLVHRYGGRLTAKWVYGMVICGDNGVREFSWSHDHFYLVEEPSEKRTVGYPLDSISVDPGTGTYFVDLDERGNTKYDDGREIENVVEFIVDSVSG